MDWEEAKKMRDLEHQLAAAQAETREMRAELSAWRELHAAATVGAPDLWPNVWQKDVSAVAFVIHQQRAELARVRGLLTVARCPNCDGSGTIPHGPTPDGDWELQQCQWCDERAALSQPAEPAQREGE